MAIYHLAKYNGFCPVCLDTPEMLEHGNTIDCISHSISGYLMLGPYTFIFAITAVQTYKWAMRFTLEWEFYLQIIGYAESMLKKYIAGL